MVFICDISVFNKYGKLKLDSLLHPLNMDWHDLVAMLIIEQMPGISQTRLVPFMQTDKANVTKMLQLLEQKDLIRREPDRGDHRVKVSSLTDHGKAMLPQLHEIMNAWENTCFQGISQKDRKVYERVAKIITDNLMEDKI